MKALFDTSVLVAALISRHPRHPAAFAKLKAVHCGTLKGALTTHGLAELFSTLSALPLQPRLRPGEVEAMLQTSVVSHFELVALSAEIYHQAIALTARQGLASGAVYDAVRLLGARAAKCQQLFTFNLRHFHALAPGDSIIVEPES